MVTATARGELRRRCGGELIEDAAALLPYARDFGGLIERQPAAVLRPSSVESVGAALEIARGHGFSVSTRGAGHAQSGQSLGNGLVLDMTSLGRVLGFDAERSLVEVEGGATWHTVLGAAFARGMLPLGLTNAMDTTVAGTLSVGGVGAETFRVGPQVDNVAYLDVATLDGRVVRASIDEHRDLFDAVRAGLGQCGVIVRAGYPVRPCRPLLRTQCFVYDRADAFVRDACRFSDPEATGRFVTGTTLRDPFHADRLILWLFVGQEHDAGAPPPALGAPAAVFEVPAKDTPLWSEDGVPGHPFFHLTLAGSGARRKEQGINPWTEHFFTLDAGTAALDHVLSRGHAALGDAGGSAGAILVRRRSPQAPLFLTPDTELAFGLGVYARFGAGARDHAHESVSAYQESAARFGGNRYLSGHVAYSAGDWQRHFGPAFPPFAEAKTRYDEKGLLNGGFVAFPQVAPSR